MRDLLDQFRAGVAEWRQEWYEADVRVKQLVLEILAFALALVAGSIAAGLMLALASLAFGAFVVLFFVGAAAALYHHASLFKQ